MVTIVVEPPPEKHVITVRMTGELYEAIKELAHIRKTSMNQLCVTVLENVTDGVWAAERR